MPSANTLTRSAAYDKVRSLEEVGRPLSSSGLGIVTVLVNDVSMKRTSSQLPPLCGLEKSIDACQETIDRWGTSARAKKQ